MSDWKSYGDVERDFSAWWEHNNRPFTAPPDVVRIEWWLRAIVHLLFVLISEVHHEAPE